MNRSINSLFRDKALKNKKLRGAIKRAEKLKRFDLFTPECEKWNWETWDEKGNLIEKNTDVFDVEGHSCVDFYGAYQPSLWGLIQSTKEWIFEDKLSLKLHPFSFPWHGWIWVIDSLESMKREIVEAEMEAKYPLPSDHKSKAYSEAIYWQVKEGQAMYPKVPKETVREYLNSRPEKYYKASDAMWVGMDDPTCFIIDEGHFPFDLKDGWSNAKCAELIAHWLVTLDLYCGPVKSVDYPWD